MFFLCKIAERHGPKAFQTLHSTTNKQTVIPNINTNIFVNQIIFKVSICYTFKTNE